MAKFDVKAAYRLLPMRPEDFKFLRLQLGGQIFYDKMAPMGAKISAAHWEHFGDLWKWLVDHLPGFKGSSV